MMLDIRLSEIIETGTQYTKNIPLGIAISLLFAYEFFTIIPISFNDVSILSYLLNLINSLNALVLNSDISYHMVYNSIYPNIAETAFFNFTQIAALGLHLYTFGSIWLIITSVILLLAMISPIFLNKQN